LSTGKTTLVSKLTNLGKFGGVDEVGRMLKEAPAGLKRNWHLKIAALVIAVLLWALTSTG